MESALCKTAPRAEEAKTDCVAVEDVIGFPGVAVPDDVGVIISPELTFSILGRKGGGTVWTATKPCDDATCDEAVDVSRCISVKP